METVVHKELDRFWFGRSLKITHCSFVQNEETTLCPIPSPYRCCSPPGPSVCAFPRARTLEWAAFPSSRGSGLEPASLCLLHWAGRFCTTSAIWEPYALTYWVAFFLLLITRRKTVSFWERLFHRTIPVPFRGPSHKTSGAEVCRATDLPTIVSNSHDASHGIYSTITSEPWSMS